MKLYNHHKLPIIVSAIIIGLLCLQPNKVSMLYSTYLGKLFIIAIIVYYCSLSKLHGIIALLVILICCVSYQTSFEGYEKDILIDDEGPYPSTDSDLILNNDSTTQDTTQDTTTDTTTDTTQDTTQDTTTDTTPAVDDSTTPYDYSTCFTPYQSTIDFQTENCYASWLKDSSGNPITSKILPKMTDDAKQQAEDTYNSAITSKLNELKSKFNFSSTECDPCLPSCLTSVTAV